MPEKLTPAQFVFAAQESIRIATEHNAAIRRAVIATFDTLTQSQNEDR